ncbi:alpha/beta hydrolase family protein [Paludibacterium purpuratum]|uniref:Prolyl oligopeptidase family protein n=1 Tax=Paludibacterium purpuratum TaxID=1144873 RepID=A0A4R7BC58_9NEIS|nr:alpha/beta hydrolase [Paludibacterium purpuratum]TDR82243.1 prolyl oligopeptidase family protein [Paludibacterium purpuratum]
MNVANPPRTFHYGPMPCQAGELYLPVEPTPPVVCLLHGGFWRTPWGRDQMVAVARDLQQRGFAVWNLGYRRVGETGGGWRGTLEDVAVGVDALADFVANGIALDLQRVTLVGHSAGGHLALWCAAGGNTQRIRPSAVVGLAPITDLARCFAHLREPGVIAELMGGTPDEQQQRYRQASPLNLLPLGLPQLIIHGSEDEEVPLRWSSDYVTRACSAGDDAKLATIAGMDHMAFLDPASPAHGVLCRWLS